MLQIQENVPLRPKTTLKIGGEARYYAELSSKEDVEEAVKFAQEKNIPLILLGGGSNTIFADGTIEALVIKIKSDAVHVDGNSVTVEGGKFLATLINELAEQDLDLSSLTGIPGSIGGALYGNSGQGFGGTWIDTFVESVEVFVVDEWKTLTKDECGFGYRTSAFKKMNTPLIWSCTLNVPSKSKEEIKSEIDRLLQKRIDTQPHVKTAGSCFLSLNKETPAWKLIDAQGLRGTNVGGIEVSEKHANFLINKGDATFEDAKKMVEKIRNDVPEEMTVEMRFVEEDGGLSF
jgi:UDP-N-acetylmuramate dehydrogenase